VPRTFSVLAAIFQVHLAQPVYTMQNISNLDFIGAVGDGGGEWWLDVLPVTQPTVSKH